MHLVFGAGPLTLVQVRCGEILRRAAGLLYMGYGGDAGLGPPSYPFPPQDLSESSDWLNLETQVAWKWGLRAW